MIVIIMEITIQIAKKMASALLYPISIKKAYYILWAFFQKKCGMCSDPKKLDFYGVEKPTPFLLTKKDGFKQSL